MRMALWNWKRAGATTRAQGQTAEDAALAHLQAAGLALAARNYRTPGRGGGEIDLVMREPDGTLVFVEVRARASAAHGGAAASVGASKQRRIVLAAQHYLLRHHAAPPPCRFDVVALDGAHITWLRAAFDAG
ncbi:YraN family protein [Comamonadaceae bacterium OH2545_COT-014]|nr:YraN family protein [Comamonadaceae bacterium OH2545_COT-014]